MNKTTTDPAALQRPFGPFETERDAHDAAGPDYLCDVAHAERLRMELDVHLDAAGIELGAYDQHIIEWLATGGAAPVSAVVGWIVRVRQAAYDSAYADGRETGLVDGKRAERKRAKQKRAEHKRQLEDAALHTRQPVHEVEHALRTGDLRSLGDGDVDAWARFLNAGRTS